VYTHGIIEKKCETSHSSTFLKCKKRRTIKLGLFNMIFLQIVTLHEQKHIIPHGNLAFKLSHINMIINILDVILEFTLVFKFKKNNEPPSQMHYIITFLFDLTMFRATPTQTFSTSSYYNLLLILHQHFVHFMHTLLHDLSSTSSLACSPHFSPLDLTILTQTSSNCV
jgi:hypothetical protein